MPALLEIQGLHVEVEGKPILKGVDLCVETGEIHALMGPNGSGKSTLSNVLMGHPKYKVSQGRILFQGEDVAGLKTDERARKGMFLAFQYPVAVPGVSVANFLRASLKAGGGEAAVQSFRRRLREEMGRLKIDEKFASRYVNDGFSGGEKKRLEILQMSLLAPSLLILDEIDSGLDIDALRIVSEGINRAAARPCGVLLITHYRRILDYVRPSRVHVLLEGRIARSGGPELPAELEKVGYVASRGPEPSEA
jgi:Fe-S cluster assembly ATP-binding protein